MLTLTRANIIDVSSFIIRASRLMEVKDIALWSFFYMLWIICWLTWRDRECSQPDPWSSHRSPQSPRTPVLESERTCKETGQWWTVPLPFKHYQYDWNAATSKIKLLIIQYRWLAVTNELTWSGLGFHPVCHGAPVLWSKQRCWQWG